MSLPKPATGVDASQSVGLRSAVNSVTLLLLVIAAIQFPFILRKKSETEFEWVYIRTARHLTAGHDLYAPGRPPKQAFTYPPCMAVLALPFAPLPQIPARALWYLVNVGCLVVLWRGAWKLSGGGSSGLKSEHLIAGLGLACGLPYALSNMDHQQTDLLISAMLIVGTLKLANGRDLLAATLFGLAAGMKCTALLWMPFLLVRGRWKASFWLVAVAVGVNLVPDMIARPANGSLWLVEWFGRYLKPMGGAKYYPGKWFAWILDNQSIAGAATRWTTTRSTWTASGIEIVDRTKIPGARVIQLSVYAIEMTLLLGALWQVRKPRSVESNGLSREALESSIVMMLMLLLSPMSSRPHFSTILLPALCLARSAVSGEKSRRWSMICLVAAMIAGLSAAPLWGRSVARLSMWLGMISWSSALFLVGCWGLLRTQTSHTTQAAVVYRPHSPGKRLSSESRIV